MAGAGQPRSMADEEARWLLPAALLTVYIVWGSTYFAIRLVLESFPPFLMAGSRFVLAGAILFAISRLRGEPVPTRRQWLSGAAVGTLLLTAGNGGVVYAEQTVASGLAAILIATVSLWATLFGGLFGTWPSRRQWLGLGVGLAGLALLNLGGGLAGSLSGVLALLLGAMAWAFGSVWSRSLDMPRAGMSSAVEMLAGGALMLVISALLGEHVPRTASATSVLALGYLVLFGSILAFSAYVLLIRRASPAVATSYAYVNPVVAVLLGVTLGSERITFGMILALAVILAGVALVAFPSKAAKGGADRRPDVGY